jgi:integrase
MVTISAALAVYRSTRRNVWAIGRSLPIDRIESGERIRTEGASKAVAVERWLSSIDDLSNGTKAKIKGIMSEVFQHAIRYGWLNDGENPIFAVRQSTKRVRVTEPLEAAEFRALMLELPQKMRVIGIIAATTGLRISEVLGLKWMDIVTRIPRPSKLMGKTSKWCKSWCATPTSPRRWTFIQRLWRQPSGRLKAGWSMFFWIDRGKPQKVLLRVQHENQRIESVSRFFRESAKLFI